MIDLTFGYVESSRCCRTFERPDRKAVVTVVPLDASPCSIKTFSEPLKLSSSKGAATNPFSLTTAVLFHTAPGLFLTKTKAHFDDSPALQTFNATTKKQTKIRVDAYKEVVNISLASFAPN